MEFDEYDYLEKAVDARHGAAAKDEKRSSRSHRHRDVDGIDGVKNDYRRERREDRGRDLERDRERSSSRTERKERERDHHHRDRERERDRDREKDRLRRHDREEEMDYERERSKRSSSRSRRHEREPDVEYERERSTRSGSRSRRHDREMEMEMERARHRERAARERDVEREMRESRKLKEKKEAVEPEADPERDQRTVFAYQMPLKATERDVYEFFSQVGKVRDVRLIMDRNSRRSKGVGYIEFYDVTSVQAALQLAGHLFLGQPVMVKRSEAEKNLVQSTAGGTSLSAPGADRKLYVGNLHFNMTEDQLRQIFEAFGPVELVQLPLDMETGHCKGFGFIQFAQLEHAKIAQQSLNGTLEIAGRIVKVSSVTEHVGKDTGTSATDFDDDDGGGLALDARSRAILMQKLDRTGTANSIVESLGVSAINGSNTTPKALPLSNGFAARSTPAPATVVEPIGDPSDCLLLKNMFDPRTETEPDFDLDIKEDVQDECSKFGRLRHIFVDKNIGGHVYLRFENAAAAASCQRAMHLRWFARRCISAVFLRPQEYEAKFVDTTVP